jgi:translation elongation factor EF-Tu-like GTPase
MAEKTIIADVVFVSSEQGGRKVPVTSLKSGQYRPHLHLETLCEDQWKPTEITEQSTLFGVQFLEGPEVAEDSELYRVSLRLPYNIDYSPLVKGRTFTIREGLQAVGFGIVIRDGTIEQASGADSASRSSTD